jgi:hypothetical protein
VQEADLGEALCPEDLLARLLQDHGVHPVRVLQQARHVHHALKSSPDLRFASGCTRAHSVDTNVTKVRAQVSLDGQEFTYVTDTVWGSGTRARR